ncbi:hypothetical protein N7520_005539 [Penicillium odoratum]|uniref:uncharacterized protein n=1 Tax=Penicillium odoratum TaxID=1167516 RepID=UPI002548C5F8|nr:uncharacterized protein N7520_005539 [Penicillium odoratum]KAJ5758383.1 hypothetical protein N7520_005539 [Penicillium odoratum]
METLVQHQKELSTLRYLRARNFDVAAAFEQFDFAAKWRRENGIAEFYDNLDVQSFEESRKMTRSRWPAALCVRCQELHQEKVDEYLAKIDACSSVKTQSRSDSPGYILHSYAPYDHLIQFVTPLVSEFPRPNKNTPISASTYIIDISGVSLKQFFAIRKYGQESSELATKHYPETLGRVFESFLPHIHTYLPKLIGRRLLGLRISFGMSHWFDPVTRSKLFLLSSSEAKSTLLSHIDASDLPEEYGGTLKWKLKWKWQDMPNLDEPMRELVSELYESSKQEGQIVKGLVSFQDGCIQLLGRENRQPGVISSVVYRKSPSNTQVIPLNKISGTMRRKQHY